MTDLIHIDTRTPIKKLQDFIDTEEPSSKFETLVHSIFARYDLLNNYSSASSPAKRALDLMSDLEHHGINYKIGREVKA